MVVGENVGSSVKFCSEPLLKVDAVVGMILGKVVVGTVVVGDTVGSKLGMKVVGRLVGLEEGC